MTGLLAFLREKDHFLLLTHRRPDGDTLGSAAGLCLGLQALGKTAWLASNPDLTQRYAPFVRHLEAPEGYLPGAVLSLDTATRDLLPDAWRESPIDWRIDHHPSAGRTPYARGETVDPSCAACGELIIDILRGLGIPLTAELATPLYLALATDTGCFRYSSTTSRTLRMAADLMDTGLDAGRINDLVFFSKTRGRIMVESRVLDGVRFFHGGAVALATIPLALIRETGANEDDLENVSSLTRQIQGVLIGVTLREEEDGVCKVSMRTAAPYDAGKLCARLGGGGHARAGGCQLAMGLSAARAALVEIIESSFDPGAL